MSKCLLHYVVKQSKRPRDLLSAISGNDTTSLETMFINFNDY